MQPLIPAIPAAALPLTAQATPTAFDVAIAARAPISFPWHTSMDVVWRNGQLCWPAWEPDSYAF